MKVLRGIGDAKSCGWRSPVCGAAVGPAVQCGSDSRQRCGGTGQESLTLDTYQKTGRRCSARSSRRASLSSVSSSRVSETNSSSASAASSRSLSLSAFHTYCSSSNRGKAGGCSLWSAVALSLSVCLSSLAPSNHGSGEKWEQSHFKTSCLVSKLIYGKCCVTKTPHSDTIQAVKAVGDSFTNASPSSPPPTYPYTHPPFTSPTPACWNESPSISQLYLWLELQR